MKKSFSKVSISYLVFVSLCLIGCLYHVSEISSVYLKYETKIDVTIESSDQIVVPLISFCQPTNYSLKIPFEDGLTPAKLYNYSLGGQSYVISYKRLVTHLLPAPYTTNCLDYSRIGCQSKSDCIDKCKVELNLKQCNVLPSFVNMDKSNDKHDYGQCNKTISYSQCEIKYNSDDCFNQYYVLTFSVFEVLERQNLDKLLSKHPHLNSKSITSIDIVFHNEPDTIYHHSPQQYFVEFACYIAGVISLWTGFSVMSLYAVGQTFCHSGIKNKNLNDTPKILFKTTSKINQISIEEIRNSI